MFRIPDEKKIRVIIDTDAACEADDPFAIVHALMSPKLIVRGICAEHFVLDGSVEKSMQEIETILQAICLETPAFMGQKGPLDSCSEISPAVKFIIEEALREDDFAEGVLDGKDDDVNAVDGHRDEPDDPSERKPDLIVEASEHHPAHTEGAVQTGGDRQVIFIQAGFREHRYFDRIADHKDRSDRHDQIAQPHKTEASVDIAQSHKTQESGDTGYRDFF
jgi:hypothetical protein